MIEMNKELIKQALNEYNFELTENGILAISIQVELLYGKKPTIQQINEVVERNYISFMDEHKKVSENRTK